MYSNLTKKFVLSTIIALSAASLCFAGHGMSEKEGYTLLFFIVLVPFVFFSGVYFFKKITMREYTAFSLYRFLIFIGNILLGLIICYIFLSNLNEEIVNEMNYEEIAGYLLFLTPLFIGIIGVIAELKLRKEK